MDRYGWGVMALWFAMVVVVGIPSLAQRYSDPRGGIGFDVVANSLASFVLVAGTALMYYVAKSPFLPPRQRNW